MPESSSPSEKQWHFQDFSVGQVFTTMTRTVTESELTTFIGLGGFFEELFINAHRDAADSLNRHRPIPGMLTLVLAEGLYVLTGRLRNGMALLSLNDLALKTPVACGDSIRAEVEVEATRRSTSQPDRGVVTTMHRVKNHEGQEVLSYRTARMIRAARD